jgi:hypothetical protein
MMTNELLTREDLQQLMRLSVFTFNGSVLISQAEGRACSQTLHLANSRMQRTERSSTAIEAINEAMA